MNDFVKGYMNMLDIGGTHELFTLQYIENMAIKNGYVPFKENNLYRRGNKLIFRYRDKFLALVRLGIDITQGANIIVSHVDSPRLDVIVGKPIIENEDGVFFKVIPYGGIITQSWLDRPLALVGRVQTDDGITYIYDSEKVSRETAWKYCKQNSPSKNVFITTKARYHGVLEEMIAKLNQEKEVKTYEDSC